MSDVCIFGAYHYNLRNRALIKGLLMNGLKITEIHMVFPFILNDFSLKTIWTLSRMMIKLIIKLMVLKPKILIVLYPGLIPIYISFLFRKKMKIIYDPYISFYGTDAFEYKRYSPNSILGHVIYLLEYYSYRIPNLLLFDTNYHAQFFVKLFRIKTPYRRLWVGTDPSILGNINRQNKNYEESNNKNFIVSFIGYYIPLHGIDTIIESAKYCKEKIKNIHYQIIGGRKDQQLPYKQYVKENNLNDVVEFIDPMPMDDLKKFIFQSDVQLGIFGDTIKAKMVIPNKLYLGIAAGKPVITAHTKAISELFTNGENIKTSKSHDPISLAESIYELYTNEALRKKIATEGRKVFEQNCNPFNIGKDLKRYIEELL